MRLTARLQQQHLMAAALGEGVIVRGAGRAGTDDDVIGRADVHSRPSSSSFVEGRIQSHSARQQYSTRIALRPHPEERCEASRLEGWPDTAAMVETPRYARLLTMRIKITPRPSVASARSACRSSRPFAPSR